MLRIDTLTKVLDLFGLGKHGFRDGNRALAVPATDFSAAWCNSIQEEICNVIEAAGIVLDANNRSQLLQAIQQMVIGAQKAVIINNATFEASVANGEVVRWDAGNNRFDEAVADGTANNRAVGIADVTLGKVYLHGECPLFAGLTPGARYYLSGAPPGALTTVAPADGVSIGIAKSATTLYVDIDSFAGNGVTAPQFDNSTKLATMEAVQRALGSTRDVVSLSANTTLDASHVGKLIAVSAAGGYTLTLPSAATLISGASIEIFNGSGSAITVSRAGADTIWADTTGYSLTSISVGTGDTIRLQRAGAAAWVVSDGSAALKYSSMFGSSLTTSGYQRLPSGLIVQWGSFTTNASGDASITFPIAFPNQCNSVQGTYNAGATGSFCTFGAPTITGVAAGAFNNSFTKSGAATFRYLAIGW